LNVAQLTLNRSEIWTNRVIKSYRSHPADRRSIIMCSSGPFAWHWPLLSRSRLTRLVYRDVQSDTATELHDTAIIYGPRFIQPFRCSDQDVPDRPLISCIQSHNSLTSRYLLWLLVMVLAYEIETADNSFATRKKTSLASFLNSQCDSMSPLHLLC